MELEKTYTLLQGASDSSKVFGPEKDLNAVQRQYRALAKAIHPDLFPDRKELAEKAFKLLTEWFARAKDELKMGTYGEEKTFEISTKKTTYKMGSPIAHGDISDVYLSDKGILKISADPKVNDLLKNEVAVLKELHSKAVDDFSIYDRYLPKVIDSFVFNGRQVTVFESTDKLYTLKEVRNRHSVLDLRHFAWMYNRALEVLGFVHHCGYVHGSFLPCHFLINPQNHGGFLVDWCGAVKVGETIKIASPNYSDWYPLEVSGKKPAIYGTDLYMAAETMIDLLGGSYQTGKMNGIPRSIQGILKACLIVNPKYRTGDAWELYDRFKEVLQELFGKREFVDFTMEDM